MVGHLTTSSPIEQFKNDCFLSYNINSLVCVPYHITLGGHTNYKHVPLNKVFTISYYNIVNGIPLGYFAFRVNLGRVNNFSS